MYLLLVFTEGEHKLLTDCVHLYIVNPLRFMYIIIILYRVPATLNNDDDDDEKTRFAYRMKFFLCFTKILPHYMIITHIYIYYFFYFSYINAYNILHTHARTHNRGDDPRRNAR